jgi:hypothetical protein
MIVVVVVDAIFYGWWLVMAGRGVARSRIFSRSFVPPYKSNFQRIPQRRGTTSSSFGQLLQREHEST